MIFVQFSVEVAGSEIDRSGGLLFSHRLLDDAGDALVPERPRVLGVADRVGSLEAGKDANFFISKGDPLEIKTVVTNVFINGKDVGLDNKHEQLYRKYIARP